MSTIYINLVILNKNTILFDKRNEFLEIPRDTLQLENPENCLQRIANNTCGLTLNYNKVKKIGVYFDDYTVNFLYLYVIDPLEEIELKSPENIIQVHVGLIQKNKKVSRNSVRFFEKNIEAFYHSPILYNIGNCSLYIK